MKRKTLETVIREILSDYPQGTLFDCIAYELWDDGGSLPVNDAWSIARGCTIAEACEACRGRWEVWKLNYFPRAKVRDLTNTNYSGVEYPALLEVDCVPFMEIRPVVE